MKRDITLFGGDVLVMGGDSSDIKRYQKNYLIDDPRKILYQLNILDGKDVDYVADFFLDDAFQFLHERKFPIIYYSGAIYNRANPAQDDLYAVSFKNVIHQLSDEGVLMYRGGGSVQLLDSLARAGFKNIFYTFRGHNERSYFNLNVDYQEKIKSSFAAMIFCFKNDEMTLEKLCDNENLRFVLLDVFKRGDYRINTEYQIAYHLTRPIHELIKEIEASCVRYDSVRQPHIKFKG